MIGLFHSQFVECCGESLDFFDGVIVQGSGADDAEGFKVRGFGEGEGVGVSVPDAQSAVGEPFSGFAGGQIGKVQENVGTRCWSRVGSEMP